MEYRCKTPVLLLFFNRPRHAAAVLERVRMVRPARLYVHCDGPRNDTEAEKVQEVRDVLTSIDWDCQIFTLFRDENKGLRRGVSDAIDWFFRQEEMGIVLEDDCMPDPSFFPFCETLLKRYEHEPAVMHITGSNLAEQLTFNKIESYFFSRYTFVWGWASWRRAWEKMSLNLDGYEQFVAGRKIATLTGDVMAQDYLLDKFDATRNNRNNSWAYAWFYSMLKAGGLSVVPTKNLVQNTGIGASDATHTNRKDEKAAIAASSVAFPLIHPRQIRNIPDLDREIFYHSLKSRPRLLLWYLLKRAGLR